MEIFLSLGRFVQNYFQQSAAVREIDVCVRRSRQNARGPAKRAGSLS